jgi:excisionase family DNA binding protein
MSEQLLTLSEAGRRLNVSYPRITELARRGTIPIVRIGRQIRVHPGKLDEFIEKGGQPLPGNWRRQSPEAV